MGHTSLQYLQHNPFDIVKLDGNLVSSIVYLSKSLYQGYLYSPAVDRDTFAAMGREMNDDQ